MKKSDLRNKYINQRGTLSQDEVLSLSEKIFKNFLGQFKLIEGQKVHCFISMVEKNEINTASIIKYLLKHKVRIFVPKIFRGKLISIEINGKTSFMKSFYGIPEPESNLDSGEKEFDVVITPLLYCDRQGNRVGYGKGYYDQFFEGINPNALKIGVGLFSPAEIVEDVWENDVLLNYLVTPTEVLSF